VFEGGVVVGEVILFLGTLKLITFLFFFIF